MGSQTIYNLPAGESEVEGIDLDSDSDSSLKISRKHDRSFLLNSDINKEDDLDDFIEVFKEQVLGWMIEPAKRLNTGKDSKHAGFASLCLILSLFECFQSIKEGRESEIGESKQYVTECFWDIYEEELVDIDDRDTVNDRFYDQTRCGFFHQGLVRPGVHLKDDRDKNYTLRFVDQDPIGILIINRVKFIEKFEAEFKDYMEMLTDHSNEAERDNFREAWQDLYELP